MLTVPLFKSLATYGLVLDCLFLDEELYNCGSQGNNNPYGLEKNAVFRGFRQDIMVLGIEPRASCMVGKLSPTDPHPQPNAFRNSISAVLIPLFLPNPESYSFLGLAV